MKKLLLTVFIIGLLDAKMIRDAVNQTVFDTRTKLMWQDDFPSKDSAKVKTWQNAITTCENLTIDTYSDWRLPSIDELNTIADYTQYNPAISSEFKYTALNKYWSSTTYTPITGNINAWGIDFVTSSIINANKSTEYNVRCVRDL